MPQLMNGPTTWWVMTAEPWPAPPNDSHMPHNILVAAHFPAHCVMAVLSMVMVKLTCSVSPVERHPLCGLHADHRLDKYYSTVQPYHV